MVLENGPVKCQTQALGNAILTWDQWSSWVIQSTKTGFIWARNECRGFKIFLSQLRFWPYISEFRFQIEHIPGAKNVVVDGLTKMFKLDNEKLKDQVLLQRGLNSAHSFTGGGRRWKWTWRYWCRRGWSSTYKDPRWQIQSQMSRKASGFREIHNSALGVYRQIRHIMP